jgi:hypothetical protein
VTATPKPTDGAMKRVLVVAFHFAPERASGTHRLLHFARGLVEGGIDVTVLTRSLGSFERIDESLTQVFPWPAKIVRAAPVETRIGRSISAIKRVLLQPSGVDTRTTQTDARKAGTGETNRSNLRALIPTPSLARTRRLLDRIEQLPDMHKGWLQPAIKTGRDQFIRQPFHLIVASGPPWTCLRVGAQLAREFRTPFIADYRDPWTHRSGLEGYTRGVSFDWLSERMETRVLESTTLALANSPDVAKAIAEGYPKLGRSQVATVLNGSDARRRSEGASFPPSKGLVARHFGTLYAGRVIGPLVEAATIRIESGADWFVEQYGDTPDRDDIDALPRPSRTLISVSRSLPFTTAVERMHEPCVLVVIQPEWFARQVPTKLYDYLCTGNPILVLAPDDSAAWRLARQYERCTRADPEDVTGIARALKDLEEQKKAGRLSQVPTVEDTRHLTKQAISLEFLDHVKRVSE